MYLRPPLSPKLWLISASGLAVWIGACRDPTGLVERGEALPPPPSVPVGNVILGKTVLPQMDAYVRSAAANKNYGTHDTLLIQKVGKSGATRVLVAFPQAGIADSVGADSLVSATLEFTIKRANADWGTSGRAVAAHRLTRAWIEGGATWNCANDLNVGNNKTDCTGNTWSMTGSTPPFVTTPVAQSVITNAQSGVVSFDVTSDIRAFLAGQATNQGWLLKLATESETGTVVFHSKESGSKPRLVLSVRKNEAVPALPPDGIPSWFDHDSSYASSAVQGRFLRRVVVVLFVEGASQAQRQAAIDAVGGRVIGGAPAVDVDGDYFVEIPNAQTEAQLDSVLAALRELPQVEETDLVPPGATPQYLRPNDDAIGWRPADWQVNPDSARGDNWNLEAIAAPLAWGCTTGDTKTKIAVLDHAFERFQLEDNVAVGQSALGQYPNDTVHHGNAVAGLIAAHGNDGLATTGVMWKAGLVLVDFHRDSIVPWSAMAATIASVAQFTDARIVNLSYGREFKGTTTADRAEVNRGIAAFMRPLRRLARRNLMPLLVVPSGDEPQDAWWGVLPALRDSFPSSVIVVGGIARRFQVAAFSGLGRLIDVFAPSEFVTTLDGRGGTDNQRRGTSYAVPLVAGVAGLALTLDPSLTPAELKARIIAGAARGGRFVPRGGTAPDSAPVLHAHETLKLVAERPGMPLCGNRVWSQGGMIYAQRGAASEPLFGAGGPAGFLNVFHGGRRIDWMDNSYEVLHSAVLTGTTWAEVADRAGLTGTAPGGTYRSLGTLENDFWYSANHDNNTLIRAQNFPNVAANDVRVQTSADNGATWTDSLSFQEQGFDGTTTAYVRRRAEFAGDGTTFIEWTNIDSVGAGPFRNTNVDISYYPDGSKALLKIDVGQSINTMLTDFTQCPWASEINGVNTEECRTLRHESESYETRLAELDLATGARRPLLTLPGFLIASGAVSEAGDEMMLVRQRRRSGYDRVPRTDDIPGYTFTNTHATQSECQASWHALKNPSAPPLRVVAGPRCAKPSPPTAGALSRHCVGTRVAPFL